MLAWKHTSLYTRIVLAAIIGIFASVSVPADQLATGQVAPGFKLKDQNGKWHELEKYCGQWVVLYFYPKDDTPGCTTQACEFRDEIYAFRKANVNILGVSLDDVDSHEEFARKYSLPFSLLSDSDKAVATTYGVLKNYGVVKYSARETFLIDPEGKIAKHYKKVEPKGHAIDVINSIRKLSAESTATSETSGL
ncbi:MAG: peroxiredoxin [Gammaproteobacteria bacterium]